MAVSVKTLMDQFGNGLSIAGGVVIYRSSSTRQRIGMVNKDGTVTLTPEGERFLEEASSAGDGAGKSSYVKESKKPRTEKATASEAKKVDTSALDDLV